MNYSPKTIEALPKDRLLKLIEKAKQILKKHPVVLKMCKEYDVSPDIIDDIPIKFGHLEVSAKTSKGVITLNYQLLAEGKFVHAYSYLIHEISHNFQQCFGGSPTNSDQEIDYLDNKFEEDSFRRQLEYIEHESGYPAADRYLENLMEYHDLDSEEKAKKKEELLPE